MDNTLETKSETAGQTKTFPSSSGQMFHEYFTANRSWSFKKNDLLDARARRLFETTALGCAADAYPFQIPLEGMSGPIVHADGHEMLMLSSYDYLGLIGDPRVNEATIDAVKKYGTGTGGARLLTGTLDIHRQLERDVAEYKGTADAITFSSGYLANLAVITSLFGPADRVIADSLSHRSLMDACRMAGVQIQRFKHNDPESLRQEIQNGSTANRTLIISDGVFSMDGDICILPELIAIKKELGCYLLMDESHASGVLGTRGTGTDEHFGVPTADVDIWTGSLAKAIPSNGGFVAVSEEMGIFLQHASSPFIFSGSIAAPAVAAARAGLAILKSEPERVAQLNSNATFLRSGLQSLGYDTGLSETPVIPVLLEDERTTALFARQLRNYGILATPVMFPAVAQGTARLRLCVTAAHTQPQLEFALDVFQKMQKH
jgi:8-amino-7-oxononanoate synthase